MVLVLRTRHAARRRRPSLRRLPGLAGLARAVAALRHLASVDAASAWRHATGLADRLADALGRPRPGQAITTFPDPDGTALRALADAGVTASGRAGRLRLAFHLWNDAEDVDRVVAVLGGLGSFRPVERPLVHSVR